MNETAKEHKSIVVNLTNYNRLVSHKIHKNQSFDEVVGKILDKFEENK